MSLFRKAGTLLNCVRGSDATKFESRHAVLSRLVEKFSYKMYQAPLAWSNDSEYLDLWKQFPEADNLIHERKFNLHSLAKAVRGVEGETAECGVFNGGGSYLIICSQEGLNKAHHIFDSFEGLSPPEANDEPSKASAMAWAKGDLAVPEERVRQNLKQFNNVYYHKGWIPQKFDVVKNKMFSFVHIDVDLFQPTLDSIAFFYDRVAKGGIIICDDYGSERCLGARKAMDEFMAEKPEPIIHITTGQGIVIKQ